VDVLIARLSANDDEGLRTEGIFRVPGDSTEMRDLREALNLGADANVELRKCDNVHSVAGLLKMFFRDLPEPILTFDLYDELIAASATLGSPSFNTDLTALQRLLQRLPTGHMQLLRHLMLFLARVASHTAESKMNVANTAAVFAPNLVRPRVESIEQLTDTVHIVNLVAFMISDPHRVFEAFAEGGDGTALVRQPSGRGTLERISTLSSDAPVSGREDSQYRLSSTSSMAAEEDDEESAVPGYLAPQEVPLAAAVNVSTEHSTSRPWYYLNCAHEQLGPVHWAELQALFRTARLNGDTYVFTEGMPNWTPFSSVDVAGSEPHWLAAARFNS
jgi:hypothetical protein